ncbi:ATP-dependent DNA ligase [Tersicoccus sp. MR15.9]|uniref:ATP-dependent DNA ligase n=1 Tax=Tersicoccus mangrovi TaxID=3121635 RepID=UPI002FE68C48
MEDVEQVPDGLTGPVPVMLARAAPDLPGPTALPGGTRWEPKWDGYRMVITVEADQVRLWSRQGKELTVAFPELAATAAAQIPTGCVLDGEAVRWAGESLDFDALQRRLTGSPRTSARLARTEPATFVAFDLLAVAGHDTRGQPYRARRQLLEALAGKWAPPLSLCPATDDLETAQRWMVEMPAHGIEGVVAKGAAQPYRGGRRDWIKVKHQDTLELVAGAVTGTLTAPGELILGRFVDGVLRIVGRTVPIGRAHRPGLVAQLRAPAGEHPWPDVIRSTALDRFNASRDSTPVTLIEPIVVEVLADTATVGGSLRHVARYVRTRPELDPADVG